MENKKVLDYALRLLSKKDYTVFELQKKFKLREFNEISVKNAIDYLLSKSILDDNKYARQYFANHANRGKVRIKFELMQKGIDEKTLSELLHEISDKSEEEKALRVAKKWLVKKSTADLNPYKLKSNLCAKLGRQGFEYSIAKKISDQLIG